MLADGVEVTARAVVLATGASYQRLGIPPLEALVGAGVFYGGGITEALAMARQHVFVVGAGNSAGQAAVHLAKYAHRVAMIVRGGGLAASMSDYLVKTIEATENIDVRLRTTVVDAHGTDRLEELVLRDASAAGWRPSRPPPCSSSSAPSRTPIGSRRDSTATTKGSSSPARTCHPAGPAITSSDGPRSHSKPACRGSSPPGTCGTARSNVLPPLWGKAA